MESELGTPGIPDPCKNIFARWFTYFFPKEYTDNASVNFCCIQGKIYAMTEVLIITEIDPDSLETLKRLKLSDGFHGRPGSGFEYNIYKLVSYKRLVNRIVQLC